MKKLLTASVFALFALNIFLPLATLCFLAFGYSFHLFSYSIYAIIVGVLSLLCAVLSLFCGEPMGNTGSVIASLQPLLVILSCVFCFLKCRSDEFFVIAISTMAALLFSVVGALKVGTSRVIKVVSVALSILCVIPVVLIGSFVSVFGDFGQNNIMETIPSPDGAQYVEVVDSDQGALGGATLVRVCKESSIDMVVFKAEKLPETLYIGEWKEYEDLNIRWKDNDSIMINSKEYDVD